MPRDRQAPKVHPGLKDPKAHQDPKASQESQEHQEHPDRLEHQACPDYLASLEQKVIKVIRETRAMPAHQRT